MIDSIPPERRRSRDQGFVFLACGIAFLGVGMVMHRTAFLSMGPVFIGLGAAFLARGRKTPPRTPGH